MIIDVEYNTFCVPKRITIIPGALFGRMAKMKRSFNLLCLSVIFSLVSTSFLFAQADDFGDGWQTQSRRLWR